MKPQDNKAEAGKRENYRTAKSTSPSTEENSMTSNKSNETTSRRRSISESQTSDDDSTESSDNSVTLSDSSSTPGNVLKLLKEAPVENEAGKVEENFMTWMDAMYEDSIKNDERKGETQNTPEIQEEHENSDIVMVTPRKREDPIHIGNKKTVKEKMVGESSKDTSLIPAEETHSDDDKVRLLKEESDLSTETPDSKPFHHIATSSCVCYKCHVDSMIRTGFPEPTDTTQMRNRIGLYQIVKALEARKRNQIAGYDEPIKKRDKERDEELYKMCDEQVEKTYARRERKKAKKRRLLHVDNATSEEDTQKRIQEWVDQGRSIENENYEWGGPILDSLTPIKEGNVQEIEEKDKIQEISFLQNPVSSVSGPESNQFIRRTAPAGMCISSYLGQSTYKVMIPGDGLCLPKAVALGIYGSEQAGEMLSKLINSHLSSGISFYRPYFSYPMHKKISDGKEIITVNNEEEYMKFLKYDDRATYAWRGNLDITILSTLLDANIRVLTVTYNEEFPLGYIEGIQHNPIREFFVGPQEANQNANLKKSVILLNEQNCHFNLLLPEEHPLVTKDRSTGSHPSLMSMIDTLFDRGFKKLHDVSMIEPVHGNVNEDKHLVVRSDIDQVRPVPSMDSEPQVTPRAGLPTCTITSTMMQDMQIDESPPQVNKKKRKRLNEDKNPFPILTRAMKRKQEQKRKRTQAFKYDVTEKPRLRKPDLWILTRAQDKIAKKKEARKDKYFQI